jgi:DNA-binding Xre family transcriptional regulator
MIRFKIGQFIEENNLSRGGVAREAKVRPNVVYEMSNNETKRVELETLDKIMDALSRLLDRPVELHEIMEYVPNQDKK